MSTLARLKEFWSVYILVHKLYLYFVYIINEIIFLLSLQCCVDFIPFGKFCKSTCVDGRKSAFTKYHFI